MNAKVSNERRFEVDSSSEEVESEPWFKCCDAEGHIEFTQEGLVTLRTHFGRAGIDIRNVRTEAQFHDAWNRASPFLNDTLLAIARNGTMTMERRLLVAIAKGDAVLAANLKSRLERRRRLGLRSV